MPEYDFLQLAATLHRDFVELDTMTARIAARFRSDEPTQETIHDVAASVVEERRDQGGSTMIFRASMPVPAREQIATALALRARQKIQNKGQAVRPETYPI